jgi:hypothetical protein
MSKTTEKTSQIDKFKDAARDLGCDDDEASFDDKLRQVAKPKPETEKPVD